MIFENSSIQEIFIPNCISIGFGFIHCGLIFKKLKVTNEINDTFIYDKINDSSQK